MTMVDTMSVAMTMVAVMMTFGRMGMNSNKGIMAVADVMTVEEDVGMCVTVGSGDMTEEEDYM